MSQWPVSVNGFSFVVSGFGKQMDHVHHALPTDRRLLYVPRIFCASLAAPSRRQRRRASRQRPHPQAAARARPGDRRPAGLATVQSPGASRLGQPHLGSKRLCAAALVDAAMAVAVAWFSREGSPGSPNPSGETDRPGARRLPADRCRIVIRAHKLVGCAAGRAGGLSRRGLTESGSPIKVRSAVRPQTPGSEWSYVSPHSTTQK